MIHLGVCYYPEQWPIERWVVDARLMREAGLTVVRLAEFAWALIEPEEGRYDFAWLDQAIETLASEGLKVVLGTPTAAPPAWLTAAHPEVLPVGPDGRVRQPGSRRHVCVTSEAFLERAGRLVREMAEHYASHEAVMGWQIDNELGCHDTARCYCLRCANGFVAWLERRYGTLQALNDAWGTVFWSQRYTDWAEILPPANMVTEANPGHWLDWCRYASDTMVGFLASQAELLRRHAPKQWLTTNWMGGFDDIVGVEAFRPLDRVGFDNYKPVGVTPAEAAMDLDRMRGLKEMPFWVLEQQVGCLNWDRYNPALRPGEVRLRTFQAIAHGADGVLFFRWRAGLVGAEQLHGGILPHSGVPGRTYLEVQTLAEDVANLPPLGLARAPVALLWSEPNRWALRQQPHHDDLRQQGPGAYDVPYYRALHARGVDVDVLPPDADMSGYRVVVAATQYLADEGLAERLRAHAEAGAQVLLGPRSGFKDEVNRVDPQGPPGALRELVGARVLAWDSPPPEVWNAVVFNDGARAEVSRWMEDLAPHVGTEVEARYTSDYMAGAPAVVSCPLGLGRVWYVGALGEDDGLAGLIVCRLLDAAGLPEWELPAGVEMAVRPAEIGSVRFLLNHNPHKVSLAVSAETINMLTQSPCGRSVELPPYGVAVLASGR